jgi:two-component system sensor histidine kinase SenX3
VPGSKRPPEKPSKFAPGKKPLSALQSQPLDRMALVAHQIRTPLSTINALAQGLMRRTDRMNTDDIKDKAEKIWRSSLQLDELIETIMSYTRASSGGIALHASAFDLRDLILRVCSDQASHQPERPFAISIESVPDFVVGDPVLLEQVLVIVLSNAMKYSGPDTPIEISGQTEDGMISLAVKDRGIGISSWDLPFLMQPFFRGRNAKNLPGTGLGLSLAWHILKLHGGGLNIESLEGQGSTVIVQLPEQP